MLDRTGNSETIDGLAGGGTVTNTAAATSSSTLTVGGNNSAGLSPYTLAAAAAGVNSTGLNNFLGVIQDGGANQTVSLTKTGSGTQILGGTNSNAATSQNTYSGATTISAGTLQLGVLNALPFGAGKGDVTIMGGNTGVAVGGSGAVFAPGTLDMGGFDQAINNLFSTTGGFVTDNPTLCWNGSAWTATGSSNFLTVGSGNATGGSFNGVIQDGFTVVPGVASTGVVGTINLIKTGAGTQTLTGANTYGGTTTVQNGTLVVSGGANRLPVTTAVTLGDAGGDSGILQVGDSTGAISQTIAGLTTTGAGTANAVMGGNATTASTLILNQTGPATYTGALGGSNATQNNLNFTLKGTGTLTLNGASNTLTGTTSVLGGSTLILASGLASSPVMVGGASAGTLVSSQTLGSLLTVNNGGVVETTNSTTTVATLTLNGGLTLNSGSTLALKIGSTATLTTPVVNDEIVITGGVFTINGGTISLSELSPAVSVGAILSSVGGNYNLIDYSAASNVGAVASEFGSLSLASSVIGSKNYFVTLVDDTVHHIIQLNVDNARFWSGATDGQWNTTVANWSPANFFVTGDKVIFGDTFPTGAGNVNVVNSNINLNATVTPAAVTFNNTAINYTLSGASDITGSTGLTKSGTGALTISNANTFTGNTLISAGYVEMQNTAALGTNAGTVTVAANGAALRLSGGIAVGAKALSLTGTGIANDGALRNVSGNNSYAGAISLGGTARINSDSGTLTLTGGISATNQNLTFGGAGNITESGVIGTGSGTLTMDGTGTVTLSNTANTYSGQTLIQNGTLSVSSIGSVTVAGGLGTAADIPSGTIGIGSGANTGTLQWTGSSTETTDRVVDLPGTTGGATLDASGTSSAVLMFSNPITYSGTGNKTLTLTGSGGTAGTPNVLQSVSDGAASTSVSLLKTGSGAWQVNGTSSYTGATTINGGFLQLGVGATLPTNLTGPTIANGSSSATLDLNGQAQTFNGINFGGGSATSAAQGNVTLGSLGTLTLGGDITYSASGSPKGAVISGPGSSALDLGGLAINLNVASSAGSGGADLTISAPITDVLTGGSLTKIGTGTAVLTGANTYVEPPP